MGRPARDLAASPPDVARLELDVDRVLHAASLRRLRAKVPICADSTVVCDREQVQLLLGRWVLGELPPEEVPRLATGLSLPSQSEALKVVVDEVARKIVAGTLAPCIGATIISGYAHDVEFGGEVWEQLSEFEAGADGCEGPMIVARGGDGRFRRDPVSLYDEDIVQEASAFLASGGLRLPPT